MAGCAARRLGPACSRLCSLPACRCCSRPCHFVNPRDPCIDWQAFCHRLPNQAATELCPGDGILPRCNCCPCSRCISLDLVKLRPRGSAAPLFVLCAPVPNRAKMAAASVAYSGGERGFSCGSDILHVACFGALKSSQEEQRREIHSLFGPQAGPEVAERPEGTRGGFLASDQREFAEKGPFSGSRLRKQLAAHHPIILGLRIRPHICTVRATSMGRTVTADRRKGDDDLIPGLQRPLGASET